LVSHVVPAIDVDNLSGSRVTLDILCMHKPRFRQILFNFKILKKPVVCVSMTIIWVRWRYSFLTSRLEERRERVWDLVQSPYSDIRTFAKLLLFAVSFFSSVCDNNSDLHKWNRFKQNKEWNKNKIMYRICKNPSTIMLKIVTFTHRYWRSILVKDFLRFITNSKRSLPYVCSFLDPCINF
jgi:hypothetical protein